MRSNNNFPCVFCHHPRLGAWRNPRSGKWAVPLTSSSCRRTGWGCCCAPCCSSSRTLWQLQQGQKKEMLKQQTLYSACHNVTGLLEQTAGQHLCALTWNVAGAAQGNLGAWQKPLQQLGTGTPWRAATALMRKAVSSMAVSSPASKLRSKGAEYGHWEPQVVFMVEFLQCIVFLFSSLYPVRTFCPSWEDL